MPPETGADGLLTWILAGVGVVVATLAGVVTTLWKTVETKNAKTLTILEERIDELTQQIAGCEKHKAEFQKLLTQQQVRITDLERQLSNQKNKT